MFRIGHGYDLHRLEPLAPTGPGKPLRLGGVPFDHPAGPVAHSDGDALLHAVTDAILGAFASADLGSLFPDTAPANAGRDSAEFLREAVKRARDAGWAVENIDATVILERPKIGPHRDRVRASIAAIIGIEPARVNVKGKTHERVDAVGEGRAVEVHAVALIRYVGV